MANFVAWIPFGSRLVDSGCKQTLRCAGMTNSQPPGASTPSRYRIIGKLGDGGMGVVYRAEDTLLARFVALKFLPEDVEHDAVALARFHREAQAASALNHRNICTVYDIGQHDGRTFIAMELLEGETLKAKLGEHPLPIETSLDYGLQIAAAINVAHQNGIVHRDIKPSNVFVTRSGEIKLADFGVAKRLPLENQSASDAPTISDALTSRGFIVGTIVYMSPEQARDENIDGRSDIFSFGIVLYEMVTGRHPFLAKTGAETLSNILRAEPQPMGELRPQLPAELGRIIGKALEKDREDRYQTAGDLAVDLRRLQRRETDKSHSAVKAARPRKGPAWLNWKTAGIAGFVSLLAGLAALIAGMSESSGIATPVSTEQITFTSETKGAPIVTDGTRLYFQSNGQSVEMSVQGGQPAPLRASLSGMTILDISPDGSQFLAQRDDQTNDETNSGSLWTVAVLGGSPRKLGKQTARGASWSPDGKLIAYTHANSVFASDGNGANFREIWKAGRQVQGRPSFSSNSQRLYVEVGGTTFRDTPKIWELNADGSNAHPLPLAWPADANQENGRWTPDGKHFVFTSYRDSPNNDIYELIQPRWFQFGKKATAVRLTSGQLGVLGFTPSRDGSGLFFVGRIPQGATEIYDQKENRFVPHLNGLSASVILVSPDRQWMVYSDFPRHFLWRSKLDGSEKLQLAQIPVFMPQWSPDSKTIAFSDFKEISIVSIYGGAPEQLTSEGNFELSPTWTHDGKSIVFSDFPNPQTLSGLKVVDVRTRKISHISGPPGLHAPSWSPDGQYMVAIAMPPKRIVLYSAKTGAWTDLKAFLADWGFFVWAPDSKCIYMAKELPEPGEQPGIYRLTIADGKWELAAKLDGLTVSSDPFENFPSIAPDGRLAMMSDTSAAQIYLMKWNESSDPNH